jgi:hypothetical protein
MAENPLKQVIGEWLPAFDFAVLQHGPAECGRDYRFILQSAGTYELVLTHVVESHYRTRVADDVWSRSWDDRFTDYRAWEAAGAPDGYVWGTNWSLAYPGLVLPDDDPGAADWSRRLGKTMHAMTVETDRFSLSMIFHGVRSRKLSDDASIIRQAIIPLA